MKITAASLFIVFGILILGGCSKQPANQAVEPTNAAGETSAAQASPSDLPATVTLTDGSRYNGVLVSKNGDQMTFKGENGASRTFDAKDIQSIRFGSSGAEAKTPAPSPAAEGAASKMSSRPVPGSPSAAAATATAPAPPPAPVRTEIVIPSGTQLSVRTNDAIDSKNAKAGETFSAEMASDVVDDSGRVAIRKGSPATLVIKSAGAGKVHANELSLDLQSVSIGGRSYDVETAAIDEKGKEGVGANKRTAKYVGGATALGAVIGAIAGHGKGAAIGAASGAAAGAGTQIFTRGSVKVPAETILTFRLEAPLRLNQR
jgi:hypothetical protein